MTAWLEHAGKKWEIRGTFSIGRLAENDLPLDDVKVSRRHALVYENAGRYWLVDFGSRNGVFLNGQPVRQPMLLSTRDEILIGDSRITFHQPGAKSSSSSPQRDKQFAETLVAGSVFAAGGSAVLLLDAQGGLLTETTQAKVWFTEYFGASAAGKLPDRVAKWFQSASQHQSATTGDPFIKQNKEKRLILRLAPATKAQWLLFLSEERPAYSIEVLQTLGLTPREAEVLHWVAEGKANAEVANVLTISVSTVNKHMESILSKLGVDNRAQAMLRVLEKLGRG